MIATPEVWYSDTSAEPPYYGLTYDVLSEQEHDGRVTIQLRSQGALKSELVVEVEPLPQIPGAEPAIYYRTRDLGVWERQTALDKYLRVG